MIFYGSTVVDAREMTRGEYNEMRGWTVPADENPDDEGFSFEIMNGVTEDEAPLIQWQPRAVFLRVYRSPGAMTFGDALEAMRAGHAVRRDTWCMPNKGLRIFSPGEFAAIGRHREATVCVTSATCGSYLEWEPTNEDLLATDWTIDFGEKVKDHE